MKPTTRYQKFVDEHHKKVKPITQTMANWSYKKLFSDYGCIQRKTLHCLECGESSNSVFGDWKDKVAEVKCPSCNKKLIVKNNYNNGLEIISYFTVLDTIGKFQIVRLIASYKKMKKCNKPEYYYGEVIRHYIDTDGKITSYAKKTCYGTGYFDQWRLGTDLELRDLTNHNLMTLYTDNIYPKTKFTPEIIRNGYKGDFCGISTQRFFSLLLSDFRFETLLKLDGKEIIYKFYKSRYTIIGDYWPIILKVLKSNYSISNINDWVDYIDLLKFFKRDITNPKYIFPDNLKKEHDRYVEKKRNYHRKMKKEQLKEQMKRNNISYKKEKKDFFDLLFSNGNINITPLKNVGDFFDEGSMLNHCVFLNEYYNNKNLLVLSAKMNKERLETIAINLNDFTIDQSRGLNNEPSLYNREIIELVNSNISKIKAIQYKRLKNKKQSA